MALTITTDTNAYNASYGFYNVGPYRFYPVKITFDSSYPTGGESVRVTGSPIPSSAKIVGFRVTGAEDATSAVNIVYYIPGTEKLMAVVGTAGANAQVSNTTDLSAVSIYGEFITWDQ